jgi:hypothetical protein
MSLFIGAMETEDPKELRYTDYICSQEMMRPIISEVSKILGIPISFIPAPQDSSGPREDKAVEVFAANMADIGRI